MKMENIKISQYYIGFINKANIKNKKYIIVYDTKIDYTK